MRKQPKALRSEMFVRECDEDVEQEIKIDVQSETAKTCKYRTRSFADGSGLSMTMVSGSVITNDISRNAQN